MEVNTVCTEEGADLQEISQELPLSIIYKDVKNKKNPGTKTY